MLMDGVGLQPQSILREPFTISFFDSQETQCDEIGLLHPLWTEELGRSKDQMRTIHLVDLQGI
jgi:hypothetical protein